MTNTNQSVPPTSDTYDGTLHKMKVLSWQGRLGRLRLLAYLTVMILVNLALSRAVSVEKIDPYILNIIMMGAMVFMASVIVRRSHDIGWSAWTLLLWLIPPIGLLIWLFKAGNPGVNAYGVPPPPNTKGVKFAAFGIPSVIIMLLMLAFVADNYLTDGQGVTQDVAVKYNAAQGDASAQYNLGAMYAKGEGVTQDDAEAVKWWKLAAAQGNANAQLVLGLKYAHGQGVTQDYVEAVKYYRLAAEQGESIAQYNLGAMYAKGQGVTQDYVEAVKYYRLAAEQGESIAQFVLGVSYENGQGVTQDDAEAVKYYRLAAEQGVAKAQTSLGVRYAKGEGVTQDYVEAVKYFRLAAEQGESIAQAMLGVMYAEGNGVTRDVINAYMWFNLAIAQGVTDAIANRDTMVKKMSKQQLAEAQELSKACLAREYKGC